MLILHIALVFPLWLVLLLYFVGFFFAVGVREASFGSGKYLAYTTMPLGASASGLDALCLATRRS